MNEVDKVRVYNLFIFPFCGSMREGGKDMLCACSDTKLNQFHDDSKFSTEYLLFSELGLTN